MSYTDIVDWSEESYDPEDFDFFDDWLEAIRNDFARQNHYFPPETIEELRSFWNKERNDNVSASETRQDVIDAINKADEFLEESRKDKNKEIGQIRNEIIGRSKTPKQFQKRLEDNPRLKRKIGKIASIQIDLAKSERKRKKLKQRVKVEKIRLSRQKDLIEKKKTARQIKRIKEQKAKAKKQRRKTRK